MVSFLLMHKFDIEAGSGDRCSSFKSPEYLSVFIEKKEQNKRKERKEQIKLKLVTH